MAVMILAGSNTRRPSLPAGRSRIGMNGTARGRARRLIMAGRHGRPRRVQRPGGHGGSAAGAACVAFSHHRAGSSCSAVVGEPCASVAVCAADYSRGVCGILPCCQAVIAVGQGYRTSRFTRTASLDAAPAIVAGRAGAGAAGRLDPAVAAPAALAQGTRPARARGRAAGADPAAAWFLPVRPVARDEAAPTAPGRGACTARRRIAAAFRYA